MALTGWGAVKGGLVSVVSVQEGVEKRRELSWDSGAICHIGMALELPGGPPHSRRVFRSRSGEQGGAWNSSEGSEVMAYASPGGVSVSVADGRVEREGGGQVGGVQKAQRLPALHFPWHARKTCRRD